MGYEQAPSTKLLAVRCCYCGRPLRDADSVECGMGPVCRSRVGDVPDVEPNWLLAQHYAPGVNQVAGMAVRYETFRNAVSKTDTHAAVNWLIHLASVVFSHGDENCGVKYPDVVMAVHHLGYTAVARVLAERCYRVRLVLTDSDYIVSVPRNDVFYQQVWNRHVGRWDREQQAYRVPTKNRKVLWALLKQCFAGEIGFGPQGSFDIKGTT